MKKTAQLRSMINSQQLEFLMEAHNALSAKIVEEAGFKGIWASGLSMSAAMGVRDSNEASWTQVMEVLEFMSDATSIPILLDGDTGYGNFNNARRLIRKLEQRDIAGVCIEDKLFPKTNSFIKGDAQPLADIEEFCGKIKAMKDSQLDDDFVVVSRVEAFIAGWGLNEALRRAEAYRIAGSDAILIHSKISDSSEIEEFMKEWGGRLPVVIVPTKYYNVPTSRFREIGISTAIWANHNLRASISAMQKVSLQIYQDENLRNIEDKIASVKEVFRLQGTKELSTAEKKYLPSSLTNTNAIILGRKTEGYPLLVKQIEHLNCSGIKDISVVRNLGEDGINCDFVSEGGDVFSLYLAKDKIKENTIISYGDIAYKPHVLHELLNDSNDIAIIVDADYEHRDVTKTYITAKTPYSKMLYSNSTDLLRISNQIESKNIHGEFIGFWKVSKKGSKIVKSALEELAKRKDFKQLTFGDLINHINLLHPVNVIYIKGLWLDLDNYLKLQKAGEVE